MLNVINMPECGFLVSIIVRATHALQITWKRVRDGQLHRAGTHFEILEGTFRRAPAWQILPIPATCTTHADERADGRAARWQPLAICSEC